MKFHGYKIVLAFFDYLFFNLSFALALRIRFSPGIDIINLGKGYVVNELVIFAFISFILLFLFETNQLYKYQILINIKNHTTKLFRVLYIDILIPLIVVIFLFRLGPRFESRLFLLSFLIVLTLIFFIYRIVIFRNIFLYLQKLGALRPRAVIYGAGKRGREVMKMICAETRFHFLGFIDDQKKKDPRLNILGDFNRIESLRRHGLVDTVIIAIDNLSHERLQELIDELKLLDIQILLISDLYQVLSRVGHIEKYEKLPLVEISYNSKILFLLVIKRVMDLVLGMLALILLSPLLLIVAVLIKVGSKGPVIYTQVRIGKDGKPFKFYKFRSMYLNNKPDEHQDFVKQFIKGEKINNGPQKIINDPRVTWIGRFIRRTSIDELPQLFNVMKGEMSLVGPRPCLPYEYQEYQNWHKIRFMVKPGCTGVWQVRGRSEVSFDDMVVMDLYYIHNISPWLDIRLILKTIPVMIFGKGGF